MPIESLCSSKFIYRAIFYAGSDINAILERNERRK